jgi:hypothetical protein
MIERNLNISKAKLIDDVSHEKLGKVGDVLLDDFKYYVENGKPHPRKLAAS